jgi:sugar/nucleoside kinase (ribokinase family)
MKEAKVKFFNDSQMMRKLDVTSVENALVDLLVRSEDSDLRELGMTKGVMQLVSAADQVRVLANLGKLTTEVELGGSAANALRGMAVLGSRVSYSSTIGHDDYGSSFSNRLETLGIRNRLAQVQGAQTGTCLVVVTPDGERTLNTHLGACLEYRAEHLPLQDIAESKVFFTTGYVWDTPGQIQAVTEAIQWAKKHDVKVAIDVADPFVVQRWGSKLSDILHASADIVFANGPEAEMLVGCTGAAAAAKLGEKIPLVVVKDGALGAYVCFESKVTHIPTHKVTVVDTTGAGDMFAGGFLAGLCKGLPLQTCGALASLLASDTITHMVVRLSKDIEARAQKALKSS